MSLKQRRRVQIARRQASWKSESSIPTLRALRSAVSRAWRGVRAVEEIRNQRGDV